MGKTLLQILDDADDGQDDCELVHLTITADQARYLFCLVDDAQRQSANANPQT